MTSSPLPLPPAAADVHPEDDPLRLVRVAAATDASEAAGDDCGDATKAGDGRARLLAVAWI